MSANYIANTNKSAGLSLLEVLVAVTILGFAFVTLFELFSEGLGRASKAEVYTFALITARSLMDETLAQDQIKEGTDFGSLDDDNYNYYVDVRRIQGETEEDKAVVFNVTVDVGWSSGGKVSLSAQKTVHEKEDGS